MKKELGAGYRVECKEVRKNNGVMLRGLLVLGENQNVAPTIYLDTFLEAYESGATFRSILDRLLDICREDMLREAVDMEFSGPLRGCVTGSVTALSAGKEMKNC